VPPAPPAGGEPLPFVTAIGSSPLVISIPHAGTGIPESLAARFTPAALAVPDTDWHVPLLYARARERGSAWIEGRLSRYAIDLNRPPDDAPLYPGQVSTGLCPTHSFAGEALYPGATPDAAEIEARRTRWWAPYHAALDALVAAACARHGHCLLLDAHSIRSEVPRLFGGVLPDLNLGTNDGRSCDDGLAQVALQVLGSQAAFSAVRDGRFKGGYITRSRGRPEAGVHALQLEIAQSAYMDEATGTWNSARSAPLVALLEELVDALLTWRPGARSGS
jgi:N-formylglutamate deformylase